MVERVLSERPGQAGQHAGCCRPTNVSPPRIQRRSGREGLLLCLGTVVVGAMLYGFDPVRYAFYPRCFFHQWTGLHCPGCGALRALHALTHGHLGTAFAFNPLLIMALPFLACAGASSLLREIRGRGLPALLTGPRWRWLALTVVLGFTALRNIPVAPFNLLAP